MNEGHLFDDDDEYFQLNDLMRLQELYGIDRNHRNPQASAPPETEQVLADCNKEMGDQKKPAPGTDVIKDVATSGVAIGKKALVRVERVMGPQIGSLSADRQQGAQIGSLSHDRQRKVIFERPVAAFSILKQRLGWS